MLRADIKRRVTLREQEEDDIRIVVIQPPAPATAMPSPLKTSVSLPRPVLPDIPLRQPYRKKIPGSVRQAPKQRWTGGNWHKKHINRFSPRTKAPYQRWNNKEIQCSDRHFFRRTEETSKARGDNGSWRHRREKQVNGHTSNTRARSEWDNWCNRREERVKRYAGRRTESFFGESNNRQRINRSIEKQAGACNKKPRSDHSKRRLERHDRRTQGSNNAARIAREQRVEKHANSSQETPVETSEASSKKRMRSVVTVVASDEVLAKDMEMIDSVLQEEDERDIPNSPITRAERELLL
jgi:hypothetical protein